MTSTVDLAELLQRHFGYAAFRPAQEAIVRAVMQGDDVLAVMPTGAGKSLCFQLPAVILPGVTLVVSPLISLMKDQVDELVRRGIGAAAIHSMVSQGDRADALRAARDGGLRLLYVAPERFASPSFLQTLADLPVARFVVDEAHCVSEWGHDFRPDYRRLAAAASACRRSDGVAGRPPILAFTATATPEVRDDIVALLDARPPRLFVSGFDRANIELRVRPVSGDAEKQALLPRLVGGARSLVYASTRRGAENAAATLVANGVAAAAYHAGLADAERTRVQNLFASGTLTVVAATNAFGMGIDRPDIEVVVHVDVPGSIEAYYQEIGRAGRDGRRAIATLLWNFADVKLREFLIDRDRPDEETRADVRPDPIERARRRELEHVKLKRIAVYANGAACLRASILRYFGDPDAREPCDACSNCLDRAVLSPEQVLLVRKIISGIARGGERYGRRKITAMLAGQTDDLPAPLASLTTTGLLRDHAPRQIERWIDAAVSAGLIQSSTDQYRILSLTALGRDVMTGRVDHVRLLVPTAAPATSRRRRARRVGAKVDVTPTNVSPDDAIVAALRAWRRDEATRRRVPAYTLLHDRTITDLAAQRPASREALLAVHGIGPAKVEAFGDAILAVLMECLKSAPPLG